MVFYNAPKPGYEWTLDNFFTPVFLSLSLFAAAGLFALGRGLFQTRIPRWAPYLVGASCLAAAFLPLGLNYGVDDQSAYTVSYDEGLNMLKTASQGGVILCNGDIDILPLWYLQFVEGKRPDVASFTTQLVSLQWYRDDIERHWPFLKTPLEGDVPQSELAVESMLHFHSAERAFYVTNIYPQGAAWLWKNHRMVPDGFLWRLADTHGQNFAFNSGRVNELWSGYHLRNLDPTERKYWDEYTDVMKDSYGQACSFTGDFAMATQSPQLAQWSYTKALEYHQPQVLGITYLKLADTELVLNQVKEAISHYEESLRREIPNVCVPYTWAKLGDAFLVDHDFPNAEQAFHTSLRMNPQQKEALDGLEWLNKARGGVTLGFRS